MTFINTAPGGAADAQQSGFREASSLLGANALLQGLPAPALQDLAQHALARTHSDGETLFHEGEAACHCLLVAQGAVEVLRYDATGEERMLHCFAPGQWVGEAAMFMPHGLYPMTARAQGATRVWRIPRQALRTACERHPLLALRLLESLSLRLYHCVNEVDWLTSSNAQQRLAAYLVARCSEGGEPVELPTSLRHLAARLGIRAETLNRLLAQWQAKGWIRGGRRTWRLCDAHQLRQLAAPGTRTF